LYVQSSEIRHLFEKNLIPAVIFSALKFQIAFIAPRINPRAKAIPACQGAPQVISGV